MKPLLYVIPECYVDTNLIEFLLDAPVNHQHCCSKVVATLENKYSGSFAIGIIDRDKVKMGYISKCDKISATYHLTLFKHKEQPQYLITISKAVDQFILDSSADQGVNPTSFGLPSKMSDFTKESKSVTSNKDPRFKSLFKALMNNQEFRNLRASLKYMVATTYNIDIDTLKALFTAP